MVLGDLGRARRLAGNPSIANVSDSDITQGLAYGTSRVISFSGKADWETDTTNTDYPTAVMAAEYYASSMIRDRFQDQGDISREHFSRAENMLRDMVNSMASGINATGGAAIALGVYRSYPLNPSAIIYRSMYSPGQQLVGVAHSYIYNY
jgi:hypothetical protein